MLSERWANLQYFTAAWKSEEECFFLCVKVASAAKSGIVRMSHRDSTVGDVQVCLVYFFLNFRGVFIEVNT